MKRWCLWVLVAAALGAPACARGGLAMLGLNRHGRLILKHYDEAVYKERLKQALLGTNDAVLAAVDGQAARERKWDLQLIAVGVALQADIGIGEFFRLGIQPGIRAFFASNDNPPPLP
jgi:hypothetical protein